jgi:hypothetical protein
MNKLRKSISVALFATVFLALPSTAFAQKGRVRWFSPPNQGNVQPFGHDRDDAVRRIEQPRPDRDLPHSVRDQLPPGLRDKPETQPGVANHLRKLDDDRQFATQNQQGQNQQGDRWYDRLSRPFPTQNQQGDRWFAQPRPGNSLPSDIRNQLPANLRDLPLDNPGVANYLGRMGIPIGPNGALLPQSTLPQSPLSQSILPQSILPQSILPQSMLPQSILPQSVLPQSILPQSILPQSGVTPSGLTPFQSQPFQPFRNFLRR